VERIACVYEQYQQKMSLRGLCRLLAFPRWRLRYHLATEKQRQQRQAKLEQARQQVKATALKHKTYGYRGVYVELKEVYPLGREKVRSHMAELGLKKQRPKRKRKSAPEFSSVCELPSGRKIQIDATRFELADGFAWKYVVEDVASRACLALKTVRQLSKEAAAAALLAAKHTLEKLGVDASLVV